MEYIILGLLIVKPMTNYEIRKLIKRDLMLICSASAGHLQTSLMKLLKSGAITVEVFTEGRVEKKKYSITPLGKIKFFEWVKSPIQPQKSKNNELSKFYFLGLLPKKEQIEMMTLYIKNLNDLKAKLTSSYHELLKTQKEPFNQQYYQNLSLKYRLDVIIFEISWFEKELHQLKKNDGVFNSG